jgi:hypothetical protein
LTRPGRGLGEHRRFGDQAEFAGVRTERACRRARRRVLDHPAGNGSRTWKTLSDSRHTNIATLAAGPTVGITAGLGGGYADRVADLTWDWQSLKYALSGGITDRDAIIFGAIAGLTAWLAKGQFSAAVR